MHIPKQSAQEIVTEISGVVNQHINMMNAQGYIIASTDPMRIGQFHEGAKKVIEEQLHELYITPEQETATTRTGLNLPIIINGEAIGVIGITGEYNKVFNYGQIVKKMTEILIKESYAKEQERLDKKIASRFLEDWILGNGANEGNAFVERGLALHIDIKRPRRAMVVRIERFQQLAASGEGQKTIEKVEHTIRDMVLEESGNVYLRLTTKQVCLVTPRSNDQMRELAQRISNTIYNAYHIILLVGIDNHPQGTTDMKSAYSLANKASHACYSPNQCVVMYEQVNMEIFMGDISQSLKEEYLRKIFVNCGMEEIRQWMRLIKAYFTAEGSINQAAARLFMHKNTLQYRLNKLQEKTGYDIRLPSHCAVFYMAMVFFRDVEKDMILSGNYSG